jgi:predicted secreted protein
LDTLTSKFGSLIPEGPNIKREIPVETIEKKTENTDVNHPEKSESEVYNNVKIEEWRSKIAEKLDLLNTLIAKNPNDRANDKRRIERDTLVWVLQNMP